MDEEVVVVEDDNNLLYIFCNIGYENNRYRNYKVFNFG